MKECPILMNGAMVRATLAGKKTQTRRPMNPQPRLGLLGDGSIIAPDYFVWDTKHGVISLTPPCMYRVLPLCPFGSPGDYLWVREAWCDTNMIGSLKTDWLKPKVNSIEYAADMDIERFPLGGNFTPRLRDFKWTPSIHMPRWASRITLEITGVRVERLNDISEDDAKAEVVNGGCIICGEPQPCRCDVPEPDFRDSFIYLWSTIYTAGEPNGWHANPWVWAVEFRVIP